MEAILKLLEVCCYFFIVSNFSIAMSANVIFSAHLEVKLGTCNYWMFRSCPM